MTPVEYLNKKGIEYKRRGDNLVFNCPFCGDTEEKAAMHVDSGVFNCMHLNRCGEKGTFWYFQSKMGDTPEPKSYDSHIETLRSKTYAKPDIKQEELSQKHRGWFNARGISNDVLLEFRVTSSGNAIVFPYYKGGELVAAKFRGPEKKFWKTKDSEPVLFNRDAVDDSDSLIICEGEVDAMSFAEYGYHNVVSVPSGASDTTWIENEWDWLNRFGKIYISMDMDDAGRRAVEVIAERLGLWRCYNVKLPFKDANECLTNGIKADVIDSAIEQAEEFRIPEITRPNEYADEVVAILTDEEYGKGRGTGFEQLDSILGGWRWGELTVWSGANGSGKTTILNQLVLDAAKKHGDRTFIASLEMKPTQLLAWIIQQGNKGGRPVDEEYIRLALDVLSGAIHMMNILGKIDADLVLDVFEFAARKYGCKHFILDSLMRVSLKGDKYEAQEAFVGRLVTFAQKYDVHVHLVAHPRKGVSDDDTPGKVDVAGTADITNQAHNVLILWRPTSEKLAKLKEEGKRTRARLFVRKNRELGRVGDINLDFNEETRRFIEIPLLVSL